MPIGTGGNFLEEITKLKYFRILRKEVLQGSLIVLQINGATFSFFLTLRSSVGNDYIIICKLCSQIY